MLTAPALKGRVFLTGGLVPWLASGCDSGRLHSDVDVAVRMGDMAHVRAWLAVEGLYDPALDSLCLECNEGHGDYGVHAAVDSALVCFCPFYSEGGIKGGLHQRNAALVETDGFEGLLEAVLPGLVESDYVEARTLPSGEDVGCATLEAVRAAKTASGREKDVRDIAEIDRIGYDSERNARVSPAYAAMRIDCIAHGE